MPLALPQHVLDISAPLIDTINARAAHWRRQGAEVYSLGQAIPGFGPPPVAIAAVRAALDRPETHVYSADAGLDSLRAALSECLVKDHQIDASPEEIVITAGGNQAFLLALLTCLEPGAEVLLPAPYFLNHEMGVRAAHGVPIEVPLGDEGFEVRLRDLEPYVTARTRAVVLVHPSNPTGAVIDGAELSRIVRAMAERDILVIADETYMHFVYGGGHTSVASLPDWRRNVLLVCTFSKSFGMTGWRVGYLLAPRDVIEQALKVQDAMIICAPVMAQCGVEAALRQAWTYPRQFLPELDARRRYLAERLGAMPGVRWVPTRGGFFAFVRVAGCADSFGLAMNLLDIAQVVTTPGSLFGKAGEGYLRLSYGSVSMPDLAKACDRIEGYFEARAGQTPGRSTDA